MSGTKMRRQLLSGTHFEVGRQLGERMRDFERPHYGAADLRFAEECARLVESLYPEALEKLRGVVAGSGLDPEQFRCHFLTKGSAVAACVGVAVGPERSLTGEPLVGRNYHWPLSDRRWCELRRVEVRGELPHLGYTHHWGGLTDVLNSAGLYVAIFSLPQVPRRGAGLQWHVIIDYLVQRCRTTPEAREFLTAVPHLRSFSYLVADAAGRAAVAEAAPTGVAVRGPEAGFLVATNHRLLGQPGPARERSRVLYEALAGRLRRRDRWDWEGLRGLMAEHELGVCVGDHTGESSAWGTLYAALLRPASQEFAVCPGFPCREPFQRVTVPAEVLQG